MPANSMSLQLIKAVKGIFEQIVLPAFCVDDDQINEEGLSATVLQHDHLKVYEQEIATDVIAEGRAIHVAGNDGAIDSFVVGLAAIPDTDAGSGGRTCTVDLKKNGVSVLSGPVALNHANTNYVAVAGTVDTANYVAGDVFTVVIALGGGSTGTHPKGVFAEASFREVAD